MKYTQNVTDPPSVEAALRNVVTAWEVLPSGRHSPTVVQTWLRDHMSPAISRARDVLGLPNKKLP